MKWFIFEMVYFSHAKTFRSYDTSRINVYTRRRLRSPNTATCRSLTGLIMCPNYRLCTASHVADIRKSRKSGNRALISAKKAQTRRKLNASILFRVAQMTNL